MSTIVLIVLIVLAVVLIAALVTGSRKARERKHEARRVEAGEHREEAETPRLACAGPGGRGGGARREGQARGGAGRRAGHPRPQRAAGAEERHQQADRIDPDVDEDAAAAERARSRGGSGVVERDDRHGDERVAGRGASVATITADAATRYASKATTCASRTTRRSASSGAADHALPTPQARH